MPRNRIALPVLALALLAAGIAVVRAQTGFADDPRLEARNAPREAQVVAYEQGLIPYIPADREAGAF